MDKTLSIGLMCHKHNSPVGGVCNSSKCKTPNPLMCIKCAVDPSSCIRRANHKMVSLKEYFSNFEVSDKLSSEIKELIVHYLKLKDINFEKVRENATNFLLKENKTFVRYDMTYKEKLTKIQKDYQSKSKEEKVLSELQLETAVDTLSKLQTTFDFETLDLAGLFSKYIKDFKEGKISLKALQDKLNGSIIELKKLSLAVSKANSLDAAKSLTFYAEKLRNSIERNLSSIEMKIKDAKFVMQHSLSEFFYKKEKLFEQPESRAKKEKTYLEEIPKAKKKVSEPLDIKKDFRGLNKTTKLRGGISIYPETSVNQMQVVEGSASDKLLAYSTGSKLVIENLQTNDKIFEITTHSSQVTEMKYVSVNLTDYLFCLMSGQRVMMIDVTNYSDKDAIDSKDLMVEGCPLDVPKVFEVVYDETTILSGGEVKIGFIFAGKSFISVHELNQQNMIQQLTQLSPPDYSEQPSKVIQLKTSIDEEHQDFCLVSSNLLVAYQLRPGEAPKVFYKYIAKKNYCHDFCVENLYSTQETYIYSAWKGGSVLIHSLKNKMLIKEVRHFALTKQPLLSIYFVNEKYLLVGRKNLLYLVNHVNMKASTLKYKEIQGNIIQVQVLYQSSKPKKILCLNSGGDLYQISA